MKLQKINDLEALSNNDYINWKKSAIQSGYLTSDASYNQIKRLYQMQQIQNAGLNPNLQLDQANAILASGQLSDLIKTRQLGEEVLPLVQLYQNNPTLATQLTDELFNSGYLTLDERNKRVESSLREFREGTDWLTGAANWIGGIFTGRRGIEDDVTSLDDYDTHAFNDYYNQVKKNRGQSAVDRAYMKEHPKEAEKEIIKEARRMYLSDMNSNIYSGIQEKIDNYYESEASKRGAVIKQQLDNNDLSPIDSNSISAEFQRIVNPREDENGTVHNGSNYYAAFKDSAFDDFKLEQQKDIIAKYQAYTEMLGPQKADEWLENQMQIWVSDHQSGLDRAINTGHAFKNTIINNIGPRMLSFGVWGLAKIADYGTRGIGYFTGHEGETNVFGDIASVIATGRDQSGRTAEQSGFRRTLGDDGAFWFLRQDYLSKVDQYNTWDRNEQQRAETNGGVTANAQYVLKPEETSPDFWSMGTIQDILGMTSQITGQVAALWLYGGGEAFTSLASQVGKNGAKALLTKEALGTILAGMKEATITASPIAESYAYGAYQQVYNGAMQNAMNNLQQDAYTQFMQTQASAEYQAEREKRYQDWLKDRGIEGQVIKFDSEQNRELFNSKYDEQKFKQFSDQFIASRKDDINGLVQSAAADAWMTSFTGEYLKYGMLNATLQPLKVLKSPNQVIASELRTNAYGRMTQSAVGKFTNEGVPLLGIKKWSTLNPKVLGTYNVVKNATIAGGLSNYTDELTTGFAMGYGLSEFNSEYMRRYNPEAYANTWHGGSAIGQFMDAVSEGVAGATRAGLTEQAWHAFEIGAIGGIFAPRLQGRGEMKEKYSQENAEYLAKTGNKSISPWKRFRQGFNTYVTGSIGEYEGTRFGLKESAKQVNDYNEAIDERDALFTELSSLNQTISHGQAAQAQNDFAQAAAAQDAVAMKLVYNEHRLSSNPLHQVSNQQTQTNIAQLSYIAQGAISDEEKERLISDAINSTQQGKQAPVTQQQKDQIWNEIQETAKRTSQFIQDYQEEEQKLLSEDASFAEAKNYPLLSQRAELAAQQARIARDINQLSSQSGVQIDTSSRGVYGQMNTRQRESMLRGAQETIDYLKIQKQKIQDEINDKKQQLEAETDEDKQKTLSKDILKSTVDLRSKDRHISELEKSIQAIENNELLRATTGVSNDATVLNDMLVNTEQYSDEQQQEIEKLRAQIGPRGEVYISEMAKLQDQLRDNEYAIEALKQSPKEYLSFKALFDASRQNARQRAIYYQELENAYSTVASLDDQVVGISAALSFTPEQFKEFQERYPSLAPSVNQYSQINDSWNAIRSLLDGQEEALQKEILSDVSDLMSVDYDFLMENGRQGVSDMLQFLKDANIGTPKADALNTLLTNFNRIQSIQSSTIAYTEYRLKKMFERAGQVADQLVEETARQEQQDIKQLPETPDTTVESPEVVPDMASMQNETGPAMDLGLETPEQPAQQETPEQAESDAEAQAESEQEQLAQQEEQEAQSEAQPEQAAQPGETELPAGVTRNSDGQVETMTAEQQAEQLGITELRTDQLVDDSAPIVQEVTGQQEEVHGCYFNMYEGSALNAGELVPFTEGPIYEWLSKEGINLGAIIDNELNNILKANPKVQLMKVKKDGEDTNVASNVFLVVEYTDKVAKHHLPENGGVIESNGKRYIIVGTMWNTKSQNGTEAANLMQATRNNLQRNGVDYFTNNPSERFYVDPVMNTEVTTFYSGHIVHTVNEESVPHTMAELLEEHNRTHTAADQMSISDLGFCAITMRDGFYPVGPYSRDKIHAPQRRTPDKYGQVSVLVPAANGEIVPIFINPTLLSEIKESELKTQIDTDIIPRLLSLDYYTREQAIIDLCQVLCISGSITNPDGKGILIGKIDVPTVSLMNGKSVIRTFDIKKGGFTIEDFKQALYRLDPRINLSLSNLTQPGWIQRYDEAGALTTDAAKLGTFGGKFYVAPIDPSTGQPIRVEKQNPVAPVNSDYSRAQPTGPTMLPVGGQRYVLRDGKWKHQDGSPITDTKERTQITWAYKVYTGEAQLVDSQGSYNYYVTGIETSKPIVVVYNTEDKTYYGVPQQLADQIVAHQREVLERARAEAAAAEALKEQPQADETPQEPVTRPADGTVKNVERTTKSGRQASGKYVASSDSEGSTHIKFKGNGYAKVRFSAEDTGLSVDDVIGVPDSYATEGAYNDLRESAEQGELIIDEVFINQQGEVTITVANGITIAGQAARVIYDKFFNEWTEDTQQQVQEAPSTNQVQKAQERLARVEAALESTEVRLWSDNPWDNVTITSTSNGFSGPAKNSRLRNTAKDHRSALGAKVGDTLRSGAKVVYRDKHGNTYIELPNAKDGEAKSAIVFPVSGRGGDNFTVHFYKTLSQDERGPLISIIREKSGMPSTSLVPYVSSLLQSLNDNLQYLRFRDQNKLNELRAKASETQAQEAPAQEATKKNDFELDDTSTKEKYSIDDIMSREDMMDQADRIFDIIDAKVNSEDATTREKWKDFDMENMEAELEKRGVNTIDIEDIDSWIDNLENCE